MILLIALGNPGKKYERTWHNAGWLAVDEFLKTHAPELVWKQEKKFEAEVLESKIGEEKIVVAKPQTYMNESGRAAAALAAYYKVDRGDVWVIHDDIDLPLGRLKISFDASAAGHNGVQSIIDALGGQDFTRFRIGIRPETLDIPTTEYVLKKIDKQSKVVFEQVLKTTESALKAALEEGVPKTMSRFN